MVVHVGDVGTTVEVTITKDDGTALNISAATEKKIRFKSLTTIVKDAAFVTDGSDGKLKYVTITADTVFARAGTWKVQGYVNLPSGKWSTDIASVTVESNL